MGATEVAGRRRGAERGGDRAGTGGGSSVAAAGQGSALPPTRRDRRRERRRRCRKAAAGALLGSGGGRRAFCLGSRRRSEGRWRRPMPPCHTWCTPALARAAPRRRGVPARCCRRRGGLELPGRGRAEARLLELGHFEGSERTVLARVSYTTAAVRSGAGSIGEQRALCSLATALLSWSCPEGETGPPYSPCGRRRAA